MINIALVNEMAMICDRLGVDVWEVIEAAATKPFGFMKFTPGPGLGGHCIPLDPHYLAWKMRTLHYKTRMIELAGEINTEMPAFWVGQAAGRAQRSRQAAQGLEGARARRRVQEGHRRPARIPALEILDLLTKKGVVVSYHDPYVPEIVDDGHTPAGAVGVSVRVYGAVLERCGCCHDRDGSLIHRLRSCVPARASRDRHAQCVHEARSGASGASSRCPRVIG